jgi:PAS domain S-box-containing protein
MLSRTDMPTASMAADTGSDALQRLVESLQRSEERLQLALEAGGMGVWEIDLRERRTTWWPGMEKLHGRDAMPPAPGPQAYLDAYVHPDDRERLDQAVREAVKGRGWHRVEYRVVWPDGRVRWLEGRGRVRHDADGRPLSMAGVSLDITRRKQGERDLQFLANAAAELAGAGDLQATLDRLAQLAVPHFADWCAIDLLQEDGTLRRVAAAHVDPDKTRMAHELHRRWPPDPDSPAGTWAVQRSGRGLLVEEITAGMLQAGTADPQLIELLRTLGLRSYIGAPLNARGRTLGVLTFVTAESGRRYAPDDLAMAEDLARRAAVAIDNARLRAELEEANRAKDVFLATLAHELRNPLAPIWNGLSIIKRAGGDAQRIEQVGGIIERQVGQLSRLVDDLLDVSRISRGKIELKQEPVSLVQVVGAAVEMSRPHIEAARHALSITFPDEPAELLGDAARLAQVFSNLLNNAAKYTRHGGHITVAVEVEGDELRVRVRDNGTGIAPEMLGKVFGLFTQVQHPSERHQGGLGIGLSLVDGLVRLHGGRVQAHSEGVDRGSEFVVHLPRLQRTRPAAALPPPAAGAPAPGGRRILVVDDNEDAASTLAELLDMAGHAVEVAHDGRSAVERTGQFRPDVVLLDIGLPDISGYEVARRIRGLGGVRQPLLVALTGWGQAQDKQAAAQAGFDLHWTKPVDPARLQELSAR